MSVEGLVAGGGVLTQVIGWWQEGVGLVAGGGRVGGSQLYGWWQQGVLAASHRVGGRRG